MIGLLVVAALFALSSGEISEDSLKRAIRDTGFILKENVIDPGRGSFENCGKAKNFSITWSPKQPSPRGSLEAEINFVTPYAWQKGSGVLEVYLKEMPQTPVIQLSEDFTCDDIRKYLPQFKCPLKANDLVHASYTDGKLPALPSGGYVIKAQILNENKEEILCGKADITINM
ncbi:uncharacterized protein LOC135465762 [Liolophura sinensis]|uniref:uncharacterized protein LOC135465762 n=1 Tax=Liolophura sinensis TaxID=3198878 RepID=UPI00315844BE